MPVQVSLVHRRYQIIHHACIRLVHNSLSFIYQFQRLGKVDVLSYPLPLPWIPNDHVFQGGGNDQGRSGPLARRLQQNDIRVSTVDYTEGRQANVAKVLLLGQRHGSTWVIVNGRRVHESCDNLRKREDLIVGVEMATARGVAYLVSTAIVVLLFTLAGVMKLTPLLSPETHGELVGSGSVV